MAPKRMNANSVPEDAPVEAARRPHGDSVKDTTESIIVAFILAFVFRTFVVEAFVIPTGSMATSLYGKHGALICDDCGWENVYGLTDTATRDPQFSPNSRVICQNCGHVNTDLAIHDGGRTRLGRPVPGNAEAGDRILVFKWPLDFGAGALGPHRWDVTVFKNPAQADENFIKRLVGLPNEVLEIIDGDVYVAPVDALSDRTMKALDDLRRIKYELRNGSQTAPAEKLRWPAPPFVLDELADALHICRKTPVAQEPLWLLVYNHDYPPHRLDARQPYWNPDPPESGDGWRTTGRRLSIDGGRATVRFAGKPILDDNAYNIELRPMPHYPVTDLRIEAVLHHRAGDGYVEFVLPKNDDLFLLRLWADGRVVMSRTDTQNGHAKVLAETLVAPLRSDKPIEVAFQNVDYRASFRVSGREVLATTDDQYAPDIRTLRQERRGLTAPPYITASDVAVDLLHVILSRDVYYTSLTFRGSEIASWAGAGWGTTGHPMWLREGEYFMLGDNSPASKDSRLWDVPGAHLLDRGEDYQLGTVPEDQLVGQAFFVYWPSGLRPGWLPVVGDFGIIPNVGRMRWIR